MSTLVTEHRESSVPALMIARCLDCGTSLAGASSCAACRRTYRTDGGIVEAIGPLTGRNRIAAAFYESPHWPRFRFWEDVFLWFQGPGAARARRQVLRHLPDLASARVLEVGIGDGANVPLLPPAWEIYGVDIARSRLLSCLKRCPEMAGRLVWAEGETLPFEDATFDAVFTVGGPNYVRDAHALLSEMRRVARPGAPLIAADERPDLYRMGLGHVLGLDLLDTWWLRISGLDPEFIRMVYETPPQIEPAAQEIWPNHRRISIWNRLGYCLVDVKET